MAKNPAYSRYLDMAPTFRWGGRDWGEKDLAAFRRMMGKRYPGWARRHPNAAKVFDPVEQQMYGAYQPELSAIDRERETRRSYYDRLMRNLGGFAGAIAPLLSGGPGAMRDLYGQGANTMTAGGTGYGAVLNADQAANAAAGNTVLDAINSPAQLQGGDAGGVLAGAAGWIPATMMNETGGAWGDRMANFPKEAGLQANLMMKDLLRQAAEEDASFSGKIQDVIAGMAGDRSKLRQGMAADKAAAADAQREWYLKLAALEMSRGNAKRANEYLRLANQREKRYTSKDKGLDVDGNPLPGYRVNPKTGKVEKIPGGGKKGSSASTVPGTPAYRAKALANVGKAQPNMEKDIAAMIKPADLTQPGTQLGDTIKPSYKQGYSQLWGKYKYLAVTPAAKKALQQAIRRLLAAAGIYPDGSPTPPGPR
jgi:hypothetical protein